MPCLRGGLLPTLASPGRPPRLPDRSVYLLCQPYLCMCSFHQDFPSDSDTKECSVFWSWSRAFLPMQASSGAGFGEGMSAGDSLARGGFGGGNVCTAWTHVARIGFVRGNTWAICTHWSVENWGWGSVQVHLDWMARRGFGRSGAQAWELYGLRWFSRWKGLGSGPSQAHWSLNG